MRIYDKQTETVLNSDDADSPWPWHPPMLHSSANSEPLPSDLLVLPCGEPTHHADKQRQKMDTHYVTVLNETLVVCKNSC